MTISVQTRHLVQYLVHKSHISIELAYDVELDKLVAYMGLDASGGSLVLDLDELEKWMNIVQDRRGERR